MDWVWFPDLSFTLNIISKLFFLIKNPFENLMEAMIPSFDKHMYMNLYKLLHIMVNSMNSRLRSPVLEKSML